MAPAKVQTCSLINKSFDNIMNIDKTQQKSVDLVNFPVGNRISLTDEGEMSRSSGHKADVENIVNIHKTSKCKKNSLGRAS